MEAMLISVNNFFVFLGFENLSLFSILLIALLPSTVHYLISNLELIDSDKTIQLITIGVVVLICMLEMLFAFPVKVESAMFLICLGILSYVLVTKTIGKRVDKKPDEKIGKD